DAQRFARAHAHLAALRCAALRARVGGRLPRHVARLVRLGTLSAAGVRAMQARKAYDQASERAALVAAGHAHLAAGRLAEADALYQQARALAPDDPEILHAQGLVSWQRGALVEADGLIAAAIARDGAQAPYH